MSLFHEVHAWNREHIARYFEVLVRVPMNVLEQRDPKGLYRRAREGVEQGVAVERILSATNIDSHR